MPNPVPKSLVNAPRGVRKARRPTSDIPVIPDLIPASKRLALAMHEPKVPYAGTVRRSSLKRPKARGVMYDKLRARRVKGDPVDVIEPHTTEAQVVKASEAASEEVSEEAKEKRGRDQRKNRRSRQSRDANYRSVLEYIEAGEIGQALKKEGWTLSEHVAILVDLVRRSEKENVILTGLKQLDNIITKSAILALKYSEQRTYGILPEGPSSPVMGHMAEGMGRLSSFLELNIGNKEKNHDDFNQDQEEIPQETGMSLSTCSAKPIKDKLGGGSEHFPPNSTSAGLVQQGTKRTKGGH